MTNWEESEMPGEHDPNDRFGMPDSAFEAALESHGRDNPVIRVGMYVPTREEVRTLPPEDLDLILDFWMWESPTELIPSREQIAAVRSVLLSRPDAEMPEVRAIVAACDDYLEPVGEEEKAEDDGEGSLDA
jgi:hypothetical protein